ncbi:MAG: hypothetical protein LBL31_05375 [Spirochaetaceae bacterium]|jgi:hypothetical protein|nr:hypothetical protein [Spirochaetaceae bacterium]
MAYREDWYPYSRVSQIYLIKTWIPILLAMREAWGIPQELVLQLAACLQTAETVLAKVNSGECTGADVARCRTVFKELEARARFIKKHYLLMPPLTSADFARLPRIYPVSPRYSPNHALCNPRNLRQI